MKKFLLIFILFFSFFSYSFAGLLGNKIETENKKEDIHINTNVTIKKGLQEVFCDKYKLYAGLSGIKEEPMYVTPLENKRIVQTYANVYGKEFLKKNKLKSIKSFYGYNNSKYWLSLEEECLNYRKEKREQDEEIKALQTQVLFFSKYYKDYPDGLTHGVLPAFFLKMFEVVDELSFWLVWITFINILVRGFLYFTSNEHDKKIKNQKAFKNSFLYFFIVFLIKIGIMGAIVTLVGYDGLDFIKLLFNV